ncbi:MAG: FmdB family zinc ribbon protein [Candidatus Margulisiibacteriota bacterium]
MPFYDYKCNQCGKVFEVFHGIRGKPSGLKCEFCGASDLQRIFYPVGSLKIGSEDLPSPSGSSCASCTSGSCRTCG